MTQPARLYPTLDDYAEHIAETADLEQPAPPILVQLLQDLGFLGAAAYTRNHSQAAIWQAILETTYLDETGRRTPRSIFRSPPGIIAWLVKQSEAATKTERPRTNPGPSAHT